MNHWHPKFTVAVALNTSLVLSLAACSNRAAYENLQINKRQECAQLPPSQYDDCMERAAQSYDDYEREREAITTE